MPSLYWLNQIQHTNPLWFGNQAFYLGHLLQSGYPVLSGLVVPAQTFQEFIESIQWREPFADLPSSSLHLNVDHPQQLQAIAQHIRHEITTTPLPELWLENLSEAASQLQATTLILQPSLALKPPADNLFALEAAEIFEPQICSAKPEALAVGLKKVWAELFRAKSLLYWQRAEIPLEQICLAVLIHPVLPAIAAGVVKVEDNLVSIQSTWGLETAIAWGEVTPDSYEVDALQGNVQAQTLGSKTCAHTLPQAPDFLPFLKDISQPAFQHPDGCLQVHLLTEAQQNRYALPPATLQQLIRIAQQLKADFSATFTFKWMWMQADIESPPELYLTQVNLPISELQQPDQIAPSWLRKTVPTEPQLILRGLAAASGQAIAEAVVITDAHLPEHIPPGRILVTTTLTPDWFSCLQQAAGLVAEQGGMTSHGAILARELGLPAIVGAAQATRIIQAGETVLLDGTQGEIYRIADFRTTHYQRQPPLTQPKPKTTLPADADSINRSGQDSPVSSPSSSPNSRWSDRPLPAIATQLLVNLSQLRFIDQVKTLPVDGIGLIRSELMLLEVLEHQHPNLWLQQGRQQEFIDRIASQVSQFAKAFAPRPVFYRALDLRSHEFQALEGGRLLPVETNPMLGLRGTFSYLVDSALFELELTALAEVQQAGYSNVHLLLPFVRTVEEFSFCRQRVEQAGLIQQAEFQLWIMAEVPSVLFLLPDYVKAGVQGISIGTNDLTQLLLGADRDQPELAAVFNERHPAVLRAIAQLIQLAQAAGIPCSICGQAPAQSPELIDHLVRWGINSISVDAEAVERTYHAIARAEHKVLLAAARRQLDLAP
ncbi:putative PEP-binding protein [Trichocoleus sp. FACHB-262]|uniref:putative PEP-binding protein n=1 Tax=Trichocoleus sp. FACHB-262 TaxID=2692869 RepID=UPI0016829C58|nr:putative PEP-binding protein [Trichocoleus sp. FACHB-262]MBD2123359.1 phosphoenolpyruvate synthase [Trichocoleus sp. FACHB-262]